MAMPAFAAEVVPVPSTTTVAPPRDDLPAAVSQRQSIDTPTLRCWQEGRLVLEQGGVNLSEAPSGAHAFRKKDRNGGTLYLFDMKNGLCVLSNEATAVEPQR
jgi:hypothetical protein